MIIKILNFTIRKSEGINKFDLYKKEVRKTGIKAGEKFDLSEAYGISFKRCLDIIAHENTFENDKTVNMDQFLKRYEDSVLKIEKIIDKLNL
jgi:hypothetical protein